MTSNFLDDIEHERATEDIKLEDTCMVIFFYFVSTVSKRNYP